MIRCLSGETETFLVYLHVKYYELDSSAISLLGSQEEGHAAVTEAGKSYSALLRLLLGPAAEVPGQL